MTPQELIDRVRQWRTANGVSLDGVLSDAYLAMLAEDVNEWLTEMGLTGPSSDAMALLYDGNLGLTPSREIAEALARDSNGNRFTLYKDTQAGRLVESADFLDAL